VVERLAKSPEVPITTQVLLEENLGKQRKDWTQSDQKRVANILHRLGFTDSRKRVHGKRLSLWIPPPDIQATAAERRAEAAAKMLAAEDARRRELESSKKKSDEHLDFS
jgi:hypothetical protein